MHCLIPRDILSPINKMKPISGAKYSSSAAAAADFVTYWATYPAMIIGSDLMCVYHLAGYEKPVSAGKVMQVRWGCSHFKI